MRVDCTAENQDERLLSTRHFYFGVMHSENLEVSVFSK